MLGEIRNKVVVAGSTITATVAGASAAFAAENEAVTGAMTTIKTDIIDTLAAVAPVAIAVFGIFLAWKYGKRIFNTVAK